MCSGGCVTCAQPPRIPLCPGLTVVTAIASGEGDYESIKVIDRVDSSGVSLHYSSEFPPEKFGNAIHVRKLNESRIVHQSDLRTAKLYLQWYGNNIPVDAPGTTGLGASSAVLTSLKSSGSAELGVFQDIYGGSPRLSTDRNQHPNIFDFIENYKLTLAQPAVVKVPVVFNNMKTELSAIRAEGRGEFYGYKAEFLFLDDETNPLALRWRIGIGANQKNGGDRDTLNVVKISVNCTGVPSSIERALAETGHADVYSIYFSFNSDEIREESEPTLREIADIMRRHPDWKLGVGGHTDAIGGDSFNLDLSKRRSAAVRSALVSSFGINTARLTTSGFGRSRPVDTNDTEEGRARNRRVELTRQ